MKSNFSIPKHKSLGFALWQVTTLWQRKLKTALEEFGLSHSSFVILASLLWLEEQSEDVTQTTVVEQTKLDKMTVSKSLKTLEHMRFIVREENPKDTRAKNIILTDKGRDQAIKSIGIVEEMDREFFSGLQYDEKENLLTFFHTLKEQ